MWKFITGTPKPSKSTYTFKMQYPFDKRKVETDRLLSKYPDKIPIIIENSDGSDLPNINKNKVIMKDAITIGQLIIYIRRKISLEPSKALFLFVDNSVIPPTQSTIGDMYNRYKDRDGFLYITYTSENTFG